MRKDDITYSIEKHIGTYSGLEGETWTGEVNIVSWNGNEPKLDMRRWAPDHARCSGGITFTVREAEKLYEILKDYHERG